MKKVLSLFLLFSALVFAQNDQIKSAEDFMQEYFQLFDDKQWDSVLEMYTDDSQVVGFGNCKSY